MNQVILIGRLTQEPKISTSKGEKMTTIARYSLAVERTYKKEGSPSADFINCVAIGKNGEFAEKYLRKGQKIAIIGRWVTGNYIGKDGSKIYTNECYVERHEFCESKNSNQNQNSYQDQPRNETSDLDINMNDFLNDKDIPF